MPVLQFITETDLALFGTARQPDRANLRTWEVAGTAHADQALQDYQLASMQRANGGQPLGDPLGCPDINDGPQRFVARRATPAVDAPVSVLSGQSRATGQNALFCGLFGSTTPFDAATLRSLYPTHADYVGQVTASGERAVAAGFLRPADAAELVATAQAAPVPPT